MKNDVTEQDRAPITPAAHELTPAQLELVTGGHCVLAGICPGTFVKR